MNIYFPATRSSTQIHQLKSFVVLILISHSFTLSLPVYLTFADPPVVTVRPENITVNETMDFLLFCEYDANPASLVSVKWRKNGKFIRVDKDERLEGGNSEQTALLVKNASRHDIGVYTCELANAIGNDTSDTDIDVDVLCEYPV